MKIAKNQSSFIHDDPDTVGSDRDSAIIDAQGNQVPDLQESRQSINLEFGIEFGGMDYELEEPTVICAQLRRFARFQDILPEPVGPLEGMSSCLLAHTTC